MSQFICPVCGRGVSAKMCATGHRAVNRVPRPFQVGQRVRIQAEENGSVLRGVVLSVTEWLLTVDVEPAPGELGGETEIPVGMCEHDASQLIQAARRVEELSGAPDILILARNSPLLGGILIHQEDCAVASGGANCTCGAEL